MQKLNKLHEFHAENKNHSNEKLVENIFSEIFEIENIAEWKINKNNWNNKIERSFTKYLYNYK